MYDKDQRVSAAFYPNFYIHKYKIASPFHAVKDISPKHFPCLSREMWRFLWPLVWGDFLNPQSLVCLSVPQGRWDWPVPVSWVGDIVLSSSVGLQGGFTQAATDTHSIREISPQLFSFNDPSVDLTLCLSTVPAPVIVSAHEELKQTGYEILFVNRKLRQVTAGDSIWLQNHIQGDILIIFNH